MAILEAALNAAHAGNAVRKHLSTRAGYLRAGDLRLQLKDFDRIFLIAIGKAAGPMALAVHNILGPKLAGGIIVTKTGHLQSKFDRLAVFETGHPIPDEAGLRASAAVIQLARDLNARDLLLVAISGGASALLPAPTQPVTLRAKQTTTDLLLRAGASIVELNTVRKHLSTLKGGGLARLAYPATVIGLLLSDVIADPIDIIGSGPTAPDTSTFSDALEVLAKFALIDRVPRVVRDHLSRGARGEIAETPKPNDETFLNVHNVVIGSNRLALRAAAKRARQLGFRPLILSSTVEGEAREVARFHAQLLREVASSGNPIPRPACLLSGGETTVTVKGPGKGGRNQEFALSAALYIDGLPNVLVLSAGTDGSDGPTDAAGALSTGETIRRAARMGMHPADYLVNNDSFAFLNRLGDLIRTGPTGTNVMDIHLLLAA